jgi:hypothetical protein
METKKQNFLSFSATAEGYEPKQVLLDGVNHLVVPVIMMVQGVHAGSEGPTLHLEENLSQSPEMWNGFPVTISHPQAIVNGEPVNISANSPQVLETSGVGRIFNATYNNGLRAEAWINEEKLEAVHPQALARLRAGEPMEVSIGVFSDTQETEGEFQGETYEKIALNYRPDHLALLPGEIGACSNSDGCGVRTNKKGGIVKELLSSFKDLSLQGYAVSLMNNQEGFQEIQNLLQNSLNAMDTQTKMYFLEEVYQNDFVYRVRNVEGGSTLYRRGYTVNNGEVTLAENPVEVRKQVEFVTMSETPSGMKRTKISNNNKNGGQSMTQKSLLCCEAKVDELIANKLTHWQASDREWLLEQGEGILAKMSPIVPEKETPSPEELQTNKDATIQAFKDGLKTIDDYTALMPEEMKAQVAGGVKLYKEHRAALVKGIMDNAEGIWEEDALNAMDDETLEKVSKTIKQPADYSALGAGGGDNGGSGEQVEIPVQYSRSGKEDK